MSKEIKAEVDKCMSELQEAIMKGTFVLNPRAEEINQKIHKLRQKCKHEYDKDGICIYCYLWKGGVE